MKLTIDDPSDAISIVPTDEKVQIGRERKYTAVVLLAIALFTIADIIEDRFDGAPWSHVLIEFIVVVFASGLAIILFHRSRAPLLRSSKLLQHELIQARADAIKWKAETRQLLEGLSGAISQQLDEWKLSEAEKEIALLLLKGLSHKEISAIRETSEQTVRQQAGSVYQKSGLTGRTELSAFFLEDLLIQPVPKQPSI